MDKYISQNGKVYQQVDSDAAIVALNADSLTHQNNIDRNTKLITNLTTQNATEQATIDANNEEIAQLQALQPKP